MHRRHRRASEKNLRLKSARLALEEWRVPSHQEIVKSLKARNPDFDIYQNLNDLKS